ncbi:MAG TPA: DUF349 domain-containing protein [Barnesiella viscericola]|uniref:DUF349 domain-containing protein n=2 Tax=Barnesiella viscericola TaxID=397865 RepID=A0A921MT69_9BACT|nr:DUF349 domain-containing protein [Barnesiella viscericola]HJG89967.1 DUF349 domain-containing protein [Barnesiella viscericola]
MNAEELHAGQTMTPAEEEQDSAQPAPKLSREEIVETLKKLVEGPVEEVKEEVDELKQAYYKQKKLEIEEAKSAFVAAGNPESDFVPAPDELEETLKSLLSVFREKKAEYTASLEKQKEENLARKQQILDEMKAITADSDNINKQYTRFQELQQAFKEPCELPSSAVSGLWKSFQACVENFYDLLKINKELRDYDFKKNLEQKTALCEAAEALLTNDDVVSAFKQLQLLHDEWRVIGPVAKELREELWNRFKDASTEVNKRYQSFFEARKEVERKNEEAKTALCEEIEAIDMNALTSFAQWDEATKHVLDLQSRWKTLGFASRKMNNVLFERFRKTCDEFFARKAEYFKAVKERMAANLEKKKALCEKAEALKDSTDWKATTDIYVALQKEWKTIGPVAKKHSDAIWKRFVSACDYFFAQKNSQLASTRQVEQENLEKKREIIARLKAIDESVEPDEAIKTVRELMAQWNTIGYVPFKEKDKIYKEYQAQLDILFARLNMNETRNRLSNFSATVQQMADGNHDKLYRERERLLRMYDQKKTELQTYENNVGFLNISSKKSSGLLKEMERKMQKIREEMQLIEQKVQLIDKNL